MSRAQPVLARGVDIAMRALVVLLVLAEPASAGPLREAIATKCYPRDEGTPRFGAGFSTGWRDTLDLVTHWHETERWIYGMRVRLGLDDGEDSLYTQEVQWAFALGRGKVLIANSLIARFKLLAFAGGGLSMIGRRDERALAAHPFAGGAVRILLARRFALDLEARASYVPDVVPTSIAARGIGEDGNIEHRRATELAASITIQLGP